MQYMGGKARIARRVVEAICADIPDRAVWFEPFVGGGNVLEHAAPVFDRCFAADAHLDLILMWEHLVAGGLLPNFVTREDYQELRSAEPSWLRGYAGFAGSFGGKWFGGYGVRGGDGPVIRNGYRSVNRQAGVFMKHRVRFTYAKFGDITPPDGAVVYCDPPYAGTTSYSSLSAFDYDSFYRTLAQWAERCSVYVSEYAVPDDVDATEIWSASKGNGLRLNGKHSIETEKLFRINPEVQP